MANKPLTDNLKSLFKILDEGGIDSREYIFDPLLARGLDYYTGAIFELKIPSYGNLSIGSGGRYDNLIGMFSKRQIPAVGFSFGLDRLIEAIQN
ncbi:MAG: Histidine-tRNA ligase [Candidatus Curtissbacteria bacterium GW2011_GWC2_41_21]|nr:MAG: Histidine-tRNA ligase [Candidatus Curtissbacteria bacterium GW2011_GWC2_41_21]